MVRAAIRLTLNRFSCKSAYRRYPLARRLAVLSDFSRPTSFNRLFRQTAAVSLLGLDLACMAGSGILTALSSDSPLGFSLVPDLPWYVWRCPGNLGFSVMVVLHHFSLLMPTFSFPDAPTCLTTRLRSRPECSPTTPCGVLGFGGSLDARSSSTRHRSTSELLRTL